MAAMLVSSSLWGEETEYTPLSGKYDFLALGDIVFKTTHVLKDGALVAWDGEGMHAGLEEFWWRFFTCKYVPEHMEIPENPTFISELKDMEGNVVNHYERDLTDVFRMIPMLDEYSGFISFGPAVNRGGDYKITASMTPGLYSFERDITLVDEAAMHVVDTRAQSGLTLNPRLSFTSGYPYEPSDFAGEKHLHWQIAAADSPTEVIAEKDEVFELKSNTPTLAAVDTLYLPVENLVPGKYIYTLTSDYAPANRTFTAEVLDVLEPQLTMDKDIYKAGESEEAVITLTMDYSYPYVGKSNSSETPTVTVEAELLKAETSESYSDESWADADMHCIAELKVPLDKVTDELVAEYDGELPLNITVKFNGISQYTSTVSLLFEKQGSGIQDVIPDTKRKIRYYNVFGVEVDESYHGLVITSDGKKIIK